MYCDNSDLIAAVGFPAQLAALKSYSQTPSKNPLQAAQKDPNARRANHKDESGNLKAEFSFQLS